MTIRVANNRYGKASVKLMKLSRDEDRHHVIDLSVDVTLMGDLESAFTQGDNSNVVPTDTIKNTIYVLAKEHQFDTIEEFGHLLTDHFTREYRQITDAEVEIHAYHWNRIPTAHGNAPAAFVSNKQETRYCMVVQHEKEEPVFRSGIRDLTILKTAQSGFENYIQDKYTTLQPTADRVLSTTLTVTWSYRDQVEDYANLYNNIRNSLLATFAEHDSKSVQHTLYAMGKEVLRVNSELKRINLAMPNEHKILADFTAFNLENNNEIFIPTREPYGVIEAELEVE